MQARLHPVHASFLLSQQSPRMHSCWAACQQPPPAMPECMACALTSGAAVDQHQGQDNLRF